jgi:hypothetical protein
MPSEPTVLYSGTAIISKGIIKENKYIVKKDVAASEFELCKCKARQPVDNKAEHDSDDGHYCGIQKRPVKGIFNKERIIAPE